MHVGHAVTRSPDTFPCPGGWWLHLLWPPLQLSPWVLVFTVQEEACCICVSGPGGDF